MKNTMIQKQRFGVEVEMTGLTRKSAAESLAKTFGTVIGHIDHSVYNVHSILQNIIYLVTHPVRGIYAAPERRSHPPQIRIAPAAALYRSRDDGGECFFRKRASDLYSRGRNDLDSLSLRRPS